MESTQTMLDSNLYNKTLSNYREREIASLELMGAIGKLMFNNNIELVFFRNVLVNSTISEILRLHEYAKDVVSKPINVIDTAKLAVALLDMNLPAAKIDIGKLCHEWVQEKAAFSSMQDFLNNKLSTLLNADNHNNEPKDVILFGFGRIGRIAARELIKQFGKGQQLRLRAIVLRKVNEKEIIKRTALLRNDSVHGAFQGSVQPDIENQAIIANGQVIKLIEASAPEAVDYTKFDINNALVIDNTGVYKDKEALSRHLQAKGVTQVLLTAPGKGIPNIVYGINQDILKLDEQNIFSAASCTTNAISPVLKVINDNFGVEKGHIETVHAYTNDQNLLDNFHKSPRRGRSAAINMVITSTGAGSAVTQVLPEFNNKLTANAVRVPTPNGSLAILHLTLNKETSVNEVNETMKKAALEGNLVNQINYAIDDELVSSDIIGNSCCSVFDSNATLVSPDKKDVVLYVWYDNEFGYTKQVIRLAKYIAKVRRLHYY
jgi:glyceraldehyde 3-phosphate dehydrogenase